MNRLATVCSLVFVGVSALATMAMSAGAQPAAKEPHWVDQGVAWTKNARDDFYSRNQGSHLMRLSWLQALKQPDGSAFAADGLARYGYLPNPASSIGLPVGFTVTSGSAPQVGMTCAACHTRQIEVGGEAYRVDGGPALVDFQALLRDLDAAVAATLATPAAFDDFASRALPGAATNVEKAQLLSDLSDWQARSHALLSLSLPVASPWGVGRADAVQMIFNRLTGLDIGATQSRVVAKNIRLADTPVRYPFLWNAAWEDKTQWMGFAPNGNDVVGMLRNMGQDIGVFAVFRPEKTLSVVNYWPDGRNSISIADLSQLEGLMKTIGAPRWPWKYDRNLASQGRDVYLNQGGCSGCHGDPRLPVGRLRTTPIQAVGTDTRQFGLLTRTADSGVLEGDRQGGIFSSPLKATDTAMSILTHAVGNTYLQSFVAGSNSGAWATLQANIQAGDRQSQTSRAQVQAAAVASAPGYEARRLEGVWAAAPYLHNGSVATLADLLKPAAQRLPSFQVGPEYDAVNVGLATSQPPGLSSTTTTTGCDQLDSGNSRCGHEYGTKLSDHDKKALLEYMKIL